ncbi:MAG: cytochrome c, partial [Gemmatimonadetes bacterium]|nr:cytochrome c [Gemmatimonadota bacterium]
MTASLGNRVWPYGQQTRRLVAFSLEGELALPEQPEPTPLVPLAAPDFQVDPALAEVGASRYSGRCSVCHSTPGRSAGMAPDLSASAVVLDAQAFQQVVREGARTPLGMPRYSELTDEQLLAL